jgi:hypothetical protein
MKRLLDKHQLLVSAQANPAQPAFSAQRGRSQNEELMRGGKL